MEGKEVLFVADPKIIVLIAVAFILGYGALWGFLRKLNRTLLRLVTLLLSFGGAFLLAKLMGKSVGRYIVSLLQPMLGDGVGNLLSQPEMSAAADALCEMIAAPILFLLAYVLLKIISWIFYKIIAVLFVPKGPKHFGRLTGALAGVLCGMVGLVVFVTPVFGYMTLTNGVLDQLAAQTQEQQTPNVLEEMLEAPVAKESYRYAGKYVFHFLTTVDFEDAKVNLEEEIGAVITILKDVMSLKGASPEQFGATEAQAVKRLAADVGASKIVSSVAASFLADASQAWLCGEQALGMSKPNLGEDVQGVADAFLQVFAVSTPETLTQDMGTFADVFVVLVESEVFTMGTDNADFVVKLVSGGVVNRLYAVLDANPRMAPVKSAIRDLGVSVMMQHLGAPEDLRANHSDLLEDMADTLKNVTKADGSIDQAVLSADVHRIMNGYEIPVSEQASQLIAEAIAENLTAEEIRSMTPAQIADRMAERFAAVGEVKQSIPAAQ